MIPGSLPLYFLDLLVLQSFNDIAIITDLQGFGCTLGSTVSISYTVDCHRAFAGGSTRHNEFVQETSWALHAVYSLIEPLMLEVYETPFSSLAAHKSSYAYLQSLYFGMEKGVS